jgi:hypothetical protein
MLSKQLLQCWIDWHRSLRVFCLGLSDLAKYPRTANLQLAFLPIEVAPVQAEYLADPQTQTCPNDSHGAIRLRDVFQNLAELFYGQYDRLTHALGGVSHPHEAHGVALISKQFPSHRAVENDPHLVFQVGPTLGCKVELL